MKTLLEIRKEAFEDESRASTVSFVENIKAAVTKAVELSPSREQIYIVFEPDPRKEPYIDSDSDLCVGYTESVLACTTLANLVDELEQDPFFEGVEIHYNFGSMRFIELMF